MVDTQRTAELQVLLEGVGLPASRRELLDYAARQSDGADFFADLQSLPDRQARSDPLLALPNEESDRPPGGDDYTKPSPQPGAVRPDWPEDHPPDKVVQQQSETQKTQKQRQEEQL